MSEENLIEFVEEPNRVKFTVHEMFVESNDDLISCDQIPVCENSPIKNSNLERKFEKSLLQFDEEESDSSSFEFKFKFNSYCSTNEDNQESKNIFLEKEHLTPFEGIDFVDDEFMEEEDFSYEVELRPDLIQVPDSSKNDVLISVSETKSNGELIIEANDHREKIELILEDLDEEFIEFEPQLVSVFDNSKSFSSKDSGNIDELHENENGNEKNSWDFDSDDEDEQDALSEHENLVQQMKMELKNCRIGALPTISEECENFKVVEDLRPLNIDQKFEYKDVMEGIQKFYKSYSEKMRKLDILNYQTLHAISFLQLKDSEVFTTGKKKASSVPYNMSKIWSYKDKKIYADPLQKSIIEMHNDLELVYVGQLCFSWEILSWLYVKAQELMEYDSKGHHSYNRVAEEFQQFQVLVQRFIEDEPFQGPIRVQNYVKSRCSTRSLLHVPTIKDDCLKDKKERREEKDAMSLASLVEIIRESMLILNEFLRADKSATNVVLNGILGTKIDRQDTANSELLADIITTLQKKDRKIREQMRSRNCIVKKLQKQEECRLEGGPFTSQVELRLVSRVLGMTKLTTDQLIWCQSKLSNINFVNRRVHVEPSFLLFPC
ncbi:hypothetical protein ACJIZ3_020153 [Penstemon smallii]|uniref:Uncharacterized protein n=1 Tax=Penstemon smallii TaxID=265156 RepID=A0ABD3SHS8_9LAMI